jgi:hypothetical protein
MAKSFPDVVIVGGGIAGTHRGITIMNGLKNEKP